LQVTERKDANESCKIQDFLKLVAVQEVAGDGKKG
jgi:hypothetical protein